MRGEDAKCVYTDLTGAIPDYDKKSVWLADTVSLIPAMDKPKEVEYSVSARCGNDKTTFSMRGRDRSEVFRKLMAGISAAGISEDSVSLEVDSEAVL